jgi:cytosine/adenosine deaminase-related metal-dependent hydrolase
VVLLAAVTDHPARLLGLAPRTIEAGAPADLVVLDTFDPAHAVSQAPAVLSSLRAGASVHTLAAPQPVAFDGSAP